MDGATAWTDLLMSWTVSYSLGPPWILKTNHSEDPTPCLRPRRCPRLVTWDFSRPYMACIRCPPAALLPFWIMSPVRLSACSAPHQFHYCQRQMLLSIKCQNNMLHEKFTHPPCMDHLSRVSTKRILSSCRRKMRSENYK